MSGGYRKQLDCGHVGTGIVGAFFLCDVRGCDTKRHLRCPKCGSTNVRPFEAPPLVPYGSYACEEHGHVWHPGA